MRKHFNTGWFNGKVIRVDVRKELWLIQYEDGDREEMNKQELITHMSQYKKYNS